MFAIILFTWLTRPMTYPDGIGGHLARKNLKAPLNSIFEQLLILNSSEFGYAFVLYVLYYFIFCWSVHVPSASCNHILLLFTRLNRLMTYLSGVGQPNASPWGSQNSINLCFLCPLLFFVCHPLPVTVVAPSLHSKEMSKLNSLYQSCFMLKCNDSQGSFLSGFICINKVYTMKKYHVKMEKL